MPRIGQPRPKDLEFPMEYTLTEIVHIKRILDCVVIDFDSNNPDEKEMVDFLNEEFYPMIYNIVKQYAPEELKKDEEEED